MGTHICVVDFRHFIADLYVALHCVIPIVVVQDRKKYSPLINKNLKTERSCLTHGLLFNQPWFVQEVECSIH